MSGVLDMTRTVLSADDRRSYRQDGFVVKRAFLTPRQMAVLQDTLANDTALKQRALGRSDGEGGAVELAVWNEPGDDAFGALARSERVVGAASELLDDEVYHYHSKLSTKRPGASGRWVWHQDYGYWYEACVFPDMLTVAVPLTTMSAENGCLQLLRGSHRAGRINHVRIGEQTGADPERVAFLSDRLEAVAFEAEPGDVMFFHCNTLHTSAPNLSTGTRDLLLVAYNARANDPVKAHHHPGYSPIDVLPDGAVEARAGQYDGEDRRFLGSWKQRSAAKPQPAG